jgi:hypothetical protein
MSTPFKYLGGKASVNGCILPEGSSSTIAISSKPVSISLHARYVPTLNKETGKLKGMQHMEKKMQAPGKISKNGPAFHQRSLNEAKKT